MMLSPEVVTHSPLSVWTVFELLLVRMASDDGDRDDQHSRNAVVTRFS